jgi:hypothetical protein
MCACLTDGRNSDLLTTDDCAQAPSAPAVNATPISRTEFRNICGPRFGKSGRQTGRHKGQIIAGMHAGLF